MRDWIDIVEAKEPRNITEAVITAYHGTGSRIEQFHDGENYFTTDRDYALGYSGKMRQIDTGKARNYLVTVRLTINHPLDTKTDPGSVEFYNRVFLPEINALNARHNREPWPEITLGRYVSFIHAHMLYLFMQSEGSPYDAILVDEGAISAAPAIIAMRGDQIEIVKREVLR